LKWTVRFSLFIDILLCKRLFESLLVGNLFEYARNPEARASPICGLPSAPANACFGFSIRIVSADDTSAAGN